MNEAASAADHQPTHLNPPVAAAGRALGRPDLWPLALLSFLLRGGLVPFLAAIVAAPTTVGLVNLIGPTVITPAGLTQGGIAILVGVSTALVVWIVVGGAIAAVAEVMLLRDIAGVLPAASGSTALTIGLVARLVIVRMYCLVPLAAALAWGSGRIVDSVYQELVLPSDLLTPLAFRVVRGAPDATAAIVACWLLGETLGGLAVRRIVLARRSVPGAVLDAIGELTRRPLAAAATAVLGVVVLVAVVGPALLATAVAWDNLRIALTGGGEPVPIAIRLAGFVAIWAGGLLVAGLVATWRMLLWTGWPREPASESARR